MDDRKVALGTRRGDVWICDNAFDKDVAKVSWSRFTHGIEPREGKGTVRVSVKRENEALRIRITDSGGGFALLADGRPAREGIGIANTRERLDHIYGSGATLLLQNAPLGGAEAIVTLPATSDLSPMLGRQAS
jgi:signal transduction histidine kinase